MALEEEQLLPLYDERATPEAAGETRLFLDDHEKMRNWLQLFSETVAQLAAETSPEDLLLKLLDRESFFLKLCSHHDNREERFLYPALDKGTTETEREKLLESADEAI
jgi:hemerythrin-like domain-containing protein